MVDRFTRVRRFTEHSDPAFVAGFLEKTAGLCDRKREILWCSWVVLQGTNFELQPASGESLRVGVNLVWAVSPPPGIHLGSLT